MKLTRLFADEDAVSPVIGVILMVAITVILAAVIGAFVLGIGDNPSQAPQVNWDVSESTNGNGWVNFTHAGGEQFSTESASLSAVNDNSSTDVEIDNNYDEVMSTGSRLDITATSSSLSNGDTVSIVWSEDGSDQESVIGDHLVTGQ